MDCFPDAVFRVHVPVANRFFHADIARNFVPDMMRLHAFCLSLLFFCASLAGAQSKQSGSTTKPPPAPTTIAIVPVIDQPLKLDDFAGMVPRSELRDKLAHVTGFIQQQPADGKPATEATEVWMAYSRSTLYFVFICHDSSEE